MDTKLLIIEAMRRLLKTKSFTNITVQNILDEAHVSRGTFYRHFKDKYEIMNAFYKEKVDAITSANIPDNRAVTGDILQFVLDNQDYFTGLLSIGGINSFKSFIFEYSKAFYLAAYCRRYGVNDKSRIPESIDFMSDFLAGGCVSTIERWVLNDCGLSKDAIVEWMYEMTPDDFQ